MSPIVVLPTRRDHQGLTKAQRLAFVVLSICILSWAVTFLFSKASSSKKKTGCLVSHGTYAGSVYSKPSETIRDECLVESPWMRLARHSVRLPLSPAGGGDGDGGHEKVIDDWLFIDYHDRINVVVEAPGHSVDGVPQEGGHRSFMILSQTKYALDDGPSLAVVGGIIEPGEEASAAARREVKEELRVTCRDWRALGGRFRTDVNRGMGWASSGLYRKLDALLVDFLSDGSCLMPIFSAIFVFVARRISFGCCATGAPVPSDGLLLFFGRSHQR